MEYEIVLGLETHVELSTKTKIFCGCTTSFKGEPNTHCCPICIGLPGVMPSLNEKVLEYAIMAGVALNCKIAEFSKMDRKNYVYPDLPKAYQISQHDKPLCFDGKLTLANGKEIGIERIHIEEDAGKLIHQGNTTFIDYNRGGVALIEIVTKPDFRDVEEVVFYLELLQKIMRYIKISDCKMQEGSLRCDVNVSVRPKGETKLGTRTEIKNMNSFSNIKKAVTFEANRQIELLEENKKVIQQTMRFNVDSKTTEPMRGKEDAHDYRYFKEPDLVLIHTKKEYVEQIKKNLPELPEAKLKRYVNQFKLKEFDANLLVEYKKVAEFFEQSVLNVKDVKSYRVCSNLILTLIFAGFETEEEKENFKIKITPKDMAKILELLETNKISNNIAKNALEKMLKTGKAVDEVISKEDLKGLTQQDLEKICKQAILENQKAVKDYLSGKTKAIKALVGFVMKQTKGRANANLAEEILEKELKTV